MDTQQKYTQRWRKCICVFVPSTWRNIVKSCCKWLNDAEAAEYDGKEVKKLVVYFDDSVGSLAVHLHHGPICRYFVKLLNWIGEFQIRQLLLQVWKFVSHTHHTVKPNFKRQRLQLQHKYLQNVLFPLTGCSYEFRNINFHSIKNFHLNRQCAF